MTSARPRDVGVLRNVLLHIFVCKVECVLQWTLQFLATLATLHSTPVGHTQGHRVGVALRLASLFLLSNGSCAMCSATCICVWAWKGLLSLYHRLSRFLGTSIAFFVWLLCLFVCLLHELHALRELPWGALICIDAVIWSDCCDPWRGLNENSEDTSTCYYWPNCGTSKCKELLSENNKNNDDGDHNNACYLIQQLKSINVNNVVNLCQTNKQI